MWIVWLGRSRCCAFFAVGELQIVDAPFEIVNGFHVFHPVR